MRKVKMESFTYMSEEGISAVCDANDRRAAYAGHDGLQYDIGLNRSDFRNLVAALAFVYESGVTDFAPDIQEADDLSEWCGDFVSSIGETLGVEFI